MQASVQVLLSTYNGVSYLREQLDSLKQQQGVQMDVLVRDDYSIDDTLEVLSEHPEVTVIKGSNIGPGASFFELINQSDDFDYYALCDQDDVWDNNKLLIALEKLKEFDTVPAIYSSNARLVDRYLNFLGEEKKNPKTTLGSAIIKNYATGCTVVFNKKLCNLVKGRTPDNVKAHDWWLNLVALSVGGISIFDDGSHISYRQHGNNVEGANTSLIRKFVRRFNKFQRPINDRQILAQKLIEIYGKEITIENICILKQVAEYKSHRLNVILNKNIRTEKFKYDFLFWICIIFKKA